MRITSKHRALTGTIDGQKPFLVNFDEDGFADVDEAVGEYLYGLHSVEKVEGGKVLESMNTAQLKKYAKDNGIDIGDETKKVQLLSIIQAASIGGDVS